MSAKPHFTLLCTCFYHTHSCVVLRQYLHIHPQLSRSRFHKCWQHKGCSPFLSLAPPFLALSLPLSLCCSLIRSCSLCNALFLLLVLPRNSLLFCFLFRFDVVKREASSCRFSFLFLVLWSRSFSLPLSLSDPNTEPLSLSLSLSVRISYASPSGWGEQGLDSSLFLSSSPSTFSGSPSSCFLTEG